MMVLTQQLGVLVVVLTVLVLQVHSIRESSPCTVRGDKTLYVKSASQSNSSCPGLPCETLDYYANVSHCNNTWLVFLPGLHTLSRNFSVYRLENITLTGANDTIVNNVTSTGAEIQCISTQQVGFVFESVKFLTFQKLSISHCGRMLLPNILNCSEELHQCQAAVALKDVHSLSMLLVGIHTNRGYGLAAEGLYGDSLIEKSSFRNNTSTKEGFVGGNLYLKYEHCPQECTKESISVVIARSIFSGSSMAYSKKTKYLFQAKATGIALIMSCTNINVHLLEVELDKNKATSYSSKGGNLFILFGNITHYTSNRVTVEDSRIANGQAIMGGGAYIRFRQPPNKPSNVSVSCDNSIAFRNTNFTSNKGEIRGGALYILFEMANTQNWYSNTTFNITNCYFEDNILNATKADSGVAINIYVFYVNGVFLTFLPFYTVTISQSHFLRNKLFTQVANSLDRVSGGATIYISNKKRETIISNLTFEDNSVPAISAFKSNIILEGNILIRNNLGIDGAGLVLCEASYILFSPHTTLTFERNSALLSGGGIYAEEQCLQSEPLCFYQINTQSNSLTHSEKLSILDTIHVIMINNTANYAGSQIFGGTLDYCYSTFADQYINGLDIYNKIFNETLWQRNQSDDSYITSYPKHVCFCENHIRNCTRKNISITIYPGEFFNVSLVAVGQFHNPVPATILAYVGNSSSALNHNTIKARCTNHSYLVKPAGSADSETLNLIVSSGTGYTAGSRLRWVNIHYNPCPLGTHRNKNGSCYWRLSSSLYYNPTNQTVHRSRNDWIGYYNETSKTESHFVFFRYCPQWYCNNESALQVNQTYFDQDAQCNDGRHGILCGACKAHQSLAISSSKYINCQQEHLRHITLLALGVLAITVLVLLFMFCFNVTITDGTLSGLLFYSSIFTINREPFLRITEHYAFLTSFFSWLNLDIGLYTCFFDGYDAFWQAIFSFCIPVFIWIVLGIIIYISSKSTRITQLVGGNAVKVLATLFLISYTKILRTEVAVLSCVSLGYREINRSLETEYFSSRWLVDGNVECWHGKHILLVVMGLLFGIATVLFTLTLLCIQPLQRNSHRRGLKWVATLKPFFDAYTSPHIIHDRYRFWTGLLLLLRMFCIVLFAISSYQNIYKHYMFIIACICILIISLMSFFGGVYKTKWLYALNVSFYFNLALLSQLSLYSLTQGTKGRYLQYIVTHVSLSVAMVTVVLILTYHIVKRLKDVGLFSWCCRKVKHTSCWQTVLKCKERRGVGYVRLPQEDLYQNREMDDDFDRERESEEEENRDQDGGNECGPSGDSY